MNVTGMGLAVGNISTGRPIGTGRVNTKCDMLAFILIHTVSVLQVNHQDFIAAVAILFIIIFLHETTAMEAQRLRCIQQEGTIQLKEADIYEAKEPLKEEYLSQSGDIIVRLTAPYTAVLIDETTSGMVVSSNFVVIRVKDKSLLPEYLFWLLNTEKIKRKIYENATSNMLGAVNARFLADFELALLSVEDQRKIAQFNLLAKRERQLLRMLTDEKEKYYAGVLNQAYKRAKKGK